MELMTDSWIQQGDGKVLLSQFPNGFCDLVITDPPYGEIDDIHRFLDDIVATEKKANMYLWCSKKYLPTLLGYAVEHQYYWDIFCWHQLNPMPLVGNRYLNDTDYCVFMKEQSVKVYGSYDSKFTYCATRLNQAEKRRHGCPVVKPFGIVENFIYNSSLPEEIVFDPFVNCGTTAAAAHYLGRRYVGVENNGDYFQTAWNRLYDTGEIE